MRIGCGIYYRRPTLLAQTPAAAKRKKKSTFMAVLCGKIETPSIPAGQLMPQKFLITF